MGIFNIFRVKKDKKTASTAHAVDAMRQKGLISAMEREADLYRAKLTLEQAKAEYEQEMAYLRGDTQTPPTPPAPPTSEEKIIETLLPYAEEFLKQKMGATHDPMKDPPLHQLTDTQQKAINAVGDMDDATLQKALKFLNPGSK